jgi:hypothetical protein
MSLGTAAIADLVRQFMSEHRERLAEGGQNSVFAGHSFRFGGGLPWQPIVAKSGTG